MVLKEILKKLLKEKDLTAAQLSRRTGVPKNTLSDWLSGNSPRDITQVKTVAEALGVSLDYLCFGQDPSPRPEKLTDLETLLGDNWVGGMFEVRLRRVKR